jgi:DedD protein
VGAVALVVLVVAVAPMILDGEPPPPPAQHIDVQIAAPRKPPPDERIPAPAPGSQARLADPATETAASPDPPVSSDSGASPGSATEPAASPRAPGQAQEADAARAGGESYAVALIATSSPAKAAQMKRTLERQKFPVYTQKTPDGDTTRVRVGPFASREVAEQARQRLVRQGYDPGKVVRAGE